MTTNQNEKRYDMLIIGGGPAGYTAALYASRAGLDTCVLDRMAPGGQMALTGDIDNYPGFDEGIDGFTLGMKMQAGAHRFGAVTDYAEVLSLDLTSPWKRVETTLGTYLGKTLIIAAGANPRALGIDGEEALLGRGVHYCAHCDGRFYKGKTVVVVGGGNSAAADALHLSRLAEKVYVVHRRDTLRAEKIYHEPLMQAENVEFLWNSTVEGFAVGERLSGVTIRNTVSGEKTELPCDGVFVSIGRQPATAFLGGCVSLDGHGYILADETTKTNVPGVYAVGDIRTKRLRQVITAAADGAAAVHEAEEYLASAVFD
ncbi:MAG: thioredoxin-disulfide reductase [Clostridia bacterium]|nr:thioredoxin-disulfide reductase [Clostridia bacterium]